MHALPRLPSRGLIEATSTSSVWPDTSAYFPGYQAGASLKRRRSRPRAPHAPPHFPGYQAGASLKLLLGVQRRGGAARHFPGYQAGASLKPHVAAHDGDVHRRLPRLPSRGLIEATNFRAWLGMEVGNFPGYQAGASLKHPPRVASSTPAPHFPGYQAGASLKLDAAQVTTVPLPYFPGYQAGASLKHLQLYYQSEPCTALPRLPSRGLIEASRPHASSARNCPSLPRLPSRGLIEAFCGWSTLILESGTSPVTKPGPH